MLKNNMLFCILIFFISSPGFSHYIRHQLSTYKDTQGLSRNRIKFDLGLNYKTKRFGLSDITYNLIFSRDRFYLQNIDEYTQEIYGSGNRTEDSLSISASQIWHKLTSTRFLFSTVNDGAIKSQTFSTGVSRWFWHESIEASLDISTTKVQRPLFEIVGEDSDIISPPTRQESTGISANIRHLANPLTITEYSILHVESNDRPPGNTYSFLIKRFIPQTKSAIHYKVARAINRGKITTKTTYGSVDAWMHEISLFQDLWKGGAARTSYRYYKEDEITRVEGDEYVIGSDAVSLNFSQNFNTNKGEKNLILEVGAMKYMTNDIAEGQKVSANIYEMRFQKTF